MKIIATSDLHGDLPDPNIMPPGDVLVLAGDILPDDYRFKYRSEIGSSRTERQGWWFESVFVPWLHSVKHTNPDCNSQVWEKRYKHGVVLVGGNHDFFLAAMLSGGIQKMLPKHVHYLNESSVEIEGVKFWGAGWNMTRGWAFCNDDTSIEEKLNYVPDMDVMVVHGPPFLGKIDALHVHWCSSALRRWVERHPMKALICGHIHEAYGKYEVGRTPVYVVSRKDRQYRDVNPFVEIDLETKVVLP